MSAATPPSSVHYSLSQTPKKGRTLTFSPPPPLLPFLRYYVFFFLSKTGNLFFFFFPNSKKNLQLAAAPPTRKKMTIKPSLPSKDDTPVMGLVSAKNFVTANAVENILSKPKKKFEEPMDMTKRPGYGEVPKYLQTIKSAINNEKEMIAEYHRQQAETLGGSMRQMTDEERESLVVELKMKWQKVNEAYQKLPFNCDSARQKFRKESLEAELTQLEKDIKKLQGRQVVVVENDY